MRLYTAQAMREADQRAVELGYPSLLLMDTAGRRVAKYALKSFPDHKPVLLCGRGNNGGDGLVAARWLKVWGAEVEVYAASGQQGDALLARQALEAHQVPIQPLEAWKPAAGTLIVDALFGTGLRGNLEGLYAHLVEQINASGLPVLAVDLPSGLPFEPFVQASLTLALAGLKHEHLFYPQRSACGQIVLDPIGMPPRALENPALPELLDPALHTLLPRRSGNAHKGSVGRVLVVGGYRSYTGAPALAALGAYRAGAGLVTVAYPADCEVVPPLEAVRLPLFEWNQANLQMARAEAIAVGMGGGDSGEPQAMAALSLGRPSVLDADALKPRVVEAFAAAGLPTVITPHPGEASRLLELPSEQIARYPLEAAASLARRYPGVVAVLKGGPSVVALQQEEVRLSVNTSGNPAMASGGMGDVLAGVIAALLAGGLRPWDAARLGVYLHGLAGDRVGRVGMLAHEVAEALPETMQALRNGRVKGFWEA